LFLLNAAFLPNPWFFLELPNILILWIVEAFPLKS
jgi:hypothetical protein